MKDYKRVLKTFMESTGIPGHEDEISRLVEAEFTEFTSDIQRDALGNLVAVIKGEGTPATPRIMIATHMDEIGLIVTRIETGGFLRVTQLGGFDPRTLVGAEVLVHAQGGSYTGIVGSKPPHLTSAEDQKKSIPLEDLFVDIGMTEASVRERVRVGDTVTIYRETMDLQNGYLAGKSLDNRASITALLIGLQELRRYRVQADVLAVATVQEEVGTRGAITSAFGLQPDIGIAIDVSHATMPGVEPDRASKMDQGPVLTFGPNIHKKLFSKLVSVAKENNIPYLTKPSQGATATDARSIQLTQAGIPTALLSLPLRYMHTSVETIQFRDIERTGKLLAAFIASVDREFVEGLRCYLKD